MNLNIIFISFISILVIYIIRQFMKNNIIDELYQKQNERLFNKQGFCLINNFINLEELNFINNHVNYVKKNFPTLNFYFTQNNYLINNINRYSIKLTSTFPLNEGYYKYVEPRPYIQHNGRKSRLQLQLEVF